MAEPPTLPAAVLRHAEANPEQPWLFRPEGWDWRWWSWKEAAVRMSTWAEQMSGLPEGSLLSFSYTAFPDLVVLDLAIQAARMVPVPVSGPVLEGWGERLDLDPSPPSPLSHRPPSGRESGNVADEFARGRAEPLRKTARDIVVLSGPLERPEERAMLSWATLAGAAIVLEPNPAVRVATAAWVRPTVFHGTAEEIAALRTWVEKEGKGGWLRRRARLPFGRLRRILVTGKGLSAEEARFWEDRGVETGGVESAV